MRTNMNDRPYWVEPSAEMVRRNNHEVMQRARIQAGMPTKKDLQEINAGLLEALEWALTHVPEPVFRTAQNTAHCARYDAARAAIQKARGES